MSESSSDIASVVNAIRSVLPPQGEKFALHEPTFHGREWQYVKECLDSGWVSYAGEFVNRFEGLLQDATGVSHALAMSSGTVALHVALMICNIKPGDEVLIPALTFVATANAAVHAGCVPHFIDSDVSTLGVSPERLDAYLTDIASMEGEVCVNRQTGRRIGAVIPMHTFGHPVDMDALLAVAAKYNIVVIEDAAESLGSLYKQKNMGSFGLVSVLSFNGNKIATTGGGGALLTNDPALAKRGKHISTTAKLPHKWEFGHDEIGYNYRMPSINAALGCAQIEQLDGFVNAKRQLADHYREVLADSATVDFFIEPSFARSNYWLNTIMVKPDLASDFTTRDNLLEALNAAGIMARPAWTLMHRLPMFADCPRMDLPVAEDLERRLINIPSSVGLVVTQ